MGFGITRMGWLGKSSQSHAIDILNTLMFDETESNCHMGFNVMWLRVGIKGYEV